MGRWFLAVETNDLNIDIKYGGKKSSKGSMKYVLQKRPLHKSVYKSERIQKFKRDNAISSTYICYQKKKWENNSSWEYNWKENISKNI